MRKSLTRLAAFTLFTLIAVAILSPLAWQFAAVRESAMDAAPRFGAVAIPMLRDALEDDDVIVRARASDALIELGAAAVPSLLDSLADARPGVRRTSARALGIIRDRSTVLVLIDALRSESDASVKSAALWSLMRFGADARAGIPAVAEVLASDADVQVRVDAAVCLGMIGHGNADAAAGLAVAHGDADASVRSAALEASGRLGLPTPSQLK